MNAVKKARIVVALLSADQEYQRLQAEDALATGDAAGLDVEVVFAENAAIVQIQQLYKFVHRPVEDRAHAIVVETVVGEGLERVARAAAAAGIGWVLLNRQVSYLEALRHAHPGLPIGMVSTDQQEIGRIQARQFRGLLSTPRAEILYVQGPSDTSAAQDRLRGVQDVLRGTELCLRLLDGRWTEESGEQAVERWLRLRSSESVRPALVGCQNDAMAVGVVRALVSCKERPELALLPVTGCDGLPEGGQKLVDGRRLAATVITPSNTGPAVRMLAHHLATRQPLPAQVLLKPESYPSESVLRLRAPA
jgi:ABC-type sugar transport system substrate-binding protein